MPEHLHVASSDEAIKELEQALWSKLIESNGGVYDHGRFIAISRDDVRQYTRGLSLTKRKRVLLAEREAMMALPLENRERVKLAKKRFIDLKALASGDNPGGCVPIFDELDLLLEQFGDSPYENQVKAQLTEAIKVLVD